MSKKSQKAKKYPKYLTVSDVIKVLEKIRAKHGNDLPVGRVGHFGEIKEISALDFDVCLGRPVPVGKTWRDAAEFADSVKILVLPCPDIGPDPE